MFETAKRTGAKTIDALLMTTGSVTEVVTGTNWPDLAAMLQALYLPVQQSLDVADQPSFVVNLCTVYYAHGRKRVIWTGEDDEALVYKLKKGELDAIVDFLERFMEANGQWEYITRQEWYTSGEYAIGIDVNYYPDRSGFSSFLAFHKDTGGNNIFVNLVFDNTTVIEATEWYVDTADPSKKRKAWQQKLLPTAYWKELDAARATLRDSLRGKEVEVSGGVSPHLYTFVSWVDDLVWHSTPNGNKRAEYSSAHAERAYQALNDTLADDFAYYDDQLGMTILGTELLGTIAEITGTHLATWLKSEGLQMQDLGFPVATRAWQQLYTGHQGAAWFLDDVKRRDLLPWRITGRYSEANAEDERLTGTESIDEPPVALSRLRRVNSREDVREEMRKALEAGKGKPRSFIRTWIRILRHDDPELTKFTFKRI